MRELMHLQLDLLFAVCVVPAHWAFEADACWEEEQTPWQRLMRISINVLSPSPVNIRTE